MATFCGRELNNGEPEELVNHPKHYNLHPSGIECIEIIRHHNFNIGSAIKYLWRAGLKDSNPTIQELEKAIWYIQDEIKRLNNQNVQNLKNTNSEKQKGE